jgi:2-polyprenyl-3-methyl-5-hydroxy-6-metoxy-1,4-benzoquinol methylase
VARPFLVREQVPTNQNLVVATQEAARSVARGSLRLCACEQCGFVFNSRFELAKVLYGDAYDNTQACSPYFESYLDKLVSELVLQKGVQHARVVEIGCGKGHFLRKLVGFPGADNRGFGFDPSYVGPDTELDGRITYERRFYGTAADELPADVVLCRHVIEHVPQPLTLLRAVRSALVGTSGARVFFETPCVEWIFENGVLWDLFYEHCSLFSAASLATAFERSGFAVERVDHVFGGQYLWIEASVVGAAPAARPAGRVAALANRFAAAEQATLRQWRIKLEVLHARGPLAIWGAGAKGATFASLVDPERAHIDCVVDINPNKQGKFLPGTGHPIVDLRSLPSRGVAVAILMNPNYRDECLALLAAARVPVDLVDWT